MSLIKSGLLCVLLIVGIASGAAQQQSRQKGEDRTTAAKRTVLTGIVDQVGNNLCWQEKSTSVPGRRCGRRVSVRTTSPVLLDIAFRSAATS